MVEVHRGRRTADVPDEGVVLFVIGMRFNRLRSVRRWAPVFAAMPRMLRELARRPELGLLHARTCLSGRSVVVLQHWRSVEQLQAYAAAADAEHLPAWRAFGRAARRGDGAVGIFHETYVVGPGSVESVYVDMPAHLLGAATGIVPVPPQRQRAADRLRAEDAPG